MGSAAAGFQESVSLFNMKEHIQTLYGELNLRGTTLKAAIDKANFDYPLGFGTPGNITEVEMVLTANSDPNSTLLYVYLMPGERAAYEMLGKATYVWFHILGS